jgi:hypothetical protein
MKAAAALLFSLAMLLGQPARADEPERRPPYSESYRRARPIGQLVALGIVIVIIILAIRSRRRTPPE